MAIQRLEIHEQAGDDGVVRLAIPTGQPNRPYHMIVIFEPDKNDGDSSCKSWPPGFLDEIVGGWTGSFVEESEGEFEKRKSF
jgi:hypothetical protein